MLEARLDYNDHIQSSFDDPAERWASDLGTAYLWLAVERDLDAYASNKNWGDFAKLLDLTWYGMPETPEDLRPYLGLLPTESRADFKDTMLIKAVCNLIRVDSSIDDVRAFAEALKNLPTMRMEGSSSAWLEEWESLLMVLFPMDPKLTATQVSAAKEKLATNKQLRLWNPLALHATGTEIMKQCANALQQRAQDDRYVHQLTQLSTAVNSFSDLGSKSLVSAAGALTIPERPGRKHT